MSLPLTAPRDLRARPGLTLGLRSDVTDYGNPTDWLYPPRRRKRGPLTPEEQAAGLMPLPPAPAGGIRARIWAFIVGASGGTRSTIVSPQFLGPAVFMDTVMSHIQAGTAVGGYSWLYAEDDSGNADSGSATLIPTGTPIFERVGRAVGTNAVNEIVEHFPNQGDSAQNASINAYRFGYLVPIVGPWFLKLSVRAQAAASTSVKGQARIIEGPSVEALLPLIAAA